MNRVLLASLPIALAAAFGPVPACAQSAAPPTATAKTGAQVYQTLCAACHGSGVAGAPKFKDAAAWKPLIEEGQAVLTGHAWVGVRAMPPKGGSPDLKLPEFARAVAYMARNAGGSWVDPDPKTLRQIAREAEERLEKTIREAQQMKRELHELGERPR